MLIYVTPSRLEKWDKDFISNGNIFYECRSSRWERDWLLDQSDLKLKAMEFLNRYDDWKATGDDQYLTIDQYHNWLNDVLLPPLPVEELSGITWPVCKDTACV